MATTDKPPPAGPRNRWAQLFIGMILGFVWGSIMWGFATLIGRDTGGVYGWLYIALPIAMLGGGVAAIFGARGARQRRERVSPRFRR